MWVPDRSKLVKVRLHNGGEDVETVWAERMREHSESALDVRLGNVPFLHAKPTYEDVIRVRPDPDDGFPTWDRAGLAFEAIPGSLVEDSGRWAMIIDWTPRSPAADPQKEFEQLDRAAELLDVAAEGLGEVDGAWRTYLAVPRRLGAEDVFRSLQITLSSLDLRLEHPL